MEFNKDKSKTIVERIKKMEEDLDRIKNPKKRKKNKKFKLPSKAKIKNIKCKKNYATIMKIQENGSVDFIKEKIEDNVVLVDNLPRSINANSVFNYKGKPFIIQPLWSIEPFSRERSMDKTMEDGKSSVGYRTLMAKMEEGVIKKKKKIGISIGLIAGLVILGIVVYALLG